MSIEMVSADDQLAFRLGKTHDERSLMHYKIPGSKTGQRNGPPYPLHQNQFSAAQIAAGARESAWVHGDPRKKHPGSAGINIHISKDKNSKKTENDSEKDKSSKQNSDGKGDNKNNQNNQNNQNGKGDNKGGSGEVIGKRQNPIITKPTSASYDTTKNQTGEITPGSSKARSTPQDKPWLSMSVDEALARSDELSNAQINDIVNRYNALEALKRCKIRDAEDEVNRLGLDVNAEYNKNLLEAQKYENANMKHLNRIQKIQSMNDYARVGLKYMNTGIEIYNTIQKITGGPTLDESVKKRMDKARENVSNKANDDKNKSTGDKNKANTANQSKESDSKKNKQKDDPNVSNAKASLFGNGSDSSKPQDSSTQKSTSEPSRNTINLKSPLSSLLGNVSDISTADISKIKSMSRTSKTQEEIAKAVGVSQSSVSEVLSKYSSMNSDSEWTTDSALNKSGSFQSLYNTYAGGKTADARRFNMSYSTIAGFDLSDIPVTKIKDSSPSYRYNIDWNKK